MQINTTPRMGIKRLLEILSTLPSRDKEELLHYIGELEHREEQLAKGIDNLFYNFIGG